MTVLLIVRYQLYDSIYACDRSGKCATYGSACRFSVDYLSDMG